MPALRVILWLMVVAAALVTNPPHQRVQNLKPFHVLALPGTDESPSHFFGGQSRDGFRHTSARVQRRQSHQPPSTGRTAEGQPLYRSGSVFPLKGDIVLSVL